jgi:hypothetical protein
MKQTLLSLALALVSSFVFAQTNPGNGETENTFTLAIEGTTTATEGTSNGETENPVTLTVEGVITATEATSNGETENPVTLRLEGATTAPDGPGNGETENPFTPKVEGITTITDGSVSSYAPDELIAVLTAGGESMSFVIGPAAKYLDKGGNDVDVSAIKEGTNVQVMAEENGDQRVASRIVVDS